MHKSNYSFFLFFQSLILYVITFQHDPKDGLDRNNYNNVQLKLIILWIPLLFSCQSKTVNITLLFITSILTQHSMEWPGSHKPVSAIFGTTHLIFILKLLLLFKVLSFSLWCTMAVTGRQRDILLYYTDISKQLITFSRHHITYAYHS